MNFQRSTGLKPADIEDPSASADGAANFLLVPDRGKITEAALIAAIWGPAQVPQSRRLIKAVCQRKH